MWSQTPLNERLAWVKAFRKSLASHLDEFCELAGAEVGKPRVETLTTDLMPVLANARWLEQRARSILRDRSLRGGGVLGMGKSQTVRREPLGRVAIIATWNYPIGLVGVELLAALVAGNTVVVKPSENAPRTQAALLRLAQAGLPEGTLTSVEPTREAGEALLHEQRFDHVVFTGSTKVGKAIAGALAPSLTPSTLELSGRDSALVLADADLDLAARSLWFVVHQNAGQTCMAPRRILVERPAYAAFLRHLGLHAAGAQPRKLISESAAERTYDLAKAAVDAGGRSLSSVIEPPNGAWLRPLAIVDCPEDAPLVEGDYFGPVTAVLPVDSEEHALEVHHRCEQHLATSVFTKSPRAAARRLAGRLGATTVTMNDCVIPTVHPAASIGGIGPSGWGVSQGEAGLLGMTRPVFVSVTHPLLRPPTDEQAPERVRQMAGFVARLYGAGPKRTSGSANATSKRADGDPAIIGDAES